MGVGEQRERGRGGGGAQGPLPLSYEGGKQVVLIIATDASQCSLRKSGKGNGEFKTDAIVFVLR